MSEEGQAVEPEDSSRAVEFIEGEIMNLEEVIKDGVENGLEARSGKGGWGDVEDIEVILPGRLLEVDVDEMRGIGVRFFDKDGAVHPGDIFWVGRLFFLKVCLSA